jgi:p-hydroxybenzoate 3-monooxygenase
MTPLRTQVAIIGSGPAGLMLGQLLHRAGIDSIILEVRSRDHVLSRIRAGVLEQTTVDLLDEIDCSQRVHSEGLVHDGVYLSFAGNRHRIDVSGLTGGARITVYGQSELTRDLMDARAAAGAPTVFEAENVAPHDFDGRSPWVSYSAHGRDYRIDCDYIAGCDGYHGVCRASVPRNALTIFERAYPLGWLGVLADVPPAAPEIVYSRHDNGFALCSMRSRTRSRYYVQCPADDDIAAWPDDRFWDVLRNSLDPETSAAVTTGPSIEKSIAILRSVVAEPMRFGRLLLAGDAAHIMPPTGAKGLNLAASDVRFLAEALIELYADGSTAGLDAYSDRALRHVWRAERFSWWMTSLLHDFHDGDVFGRKLQLADLNYLVSEQSAARSFALSFAGVAGEGM